MPEESREAVEEIIVEELRNPKGRTLYPYTPNKGGEAKELSFRTPSWERHWQKLVHFWNSRFVTDPKGDENSDHPSRKVLISNRYNKPDGIPECKEMSPYEQKDAPESRFVNFIFWLLDAGEKNVKKSKKMLKEVHFLYYYIIVCIAEKRKKIQDKRAMVKRVQRAR